MAARPRACGHGEGGFSLVILLAGLAVMMILMGAGASSWRYVMQDDREQELFFRGDQIARGIEAYQRKNGNTFPTTLEVLVKGKYLRKAYKDPMTRDGKWNFVRPGQAIKANTLASPGPGGAGGKSASPRPGSGGGSGLGGLGGAIAMGPFVGVASYSEEKSLRVFNGSAINYSDWVFLAGRPRILGRMTIPGAPPIGGPPGGVPSAKP